ncbi:MAG: ribosome biogenesis GTPase Der, partial [Planctomycetota bacterium]
MSLPKVSIVGRPNVGKSSIFNWLAGLRLAIVDEVAGVTRDRMGYVLEHAGRYFEIIDTGGIGINDVDQLDEEIEQQIEAGIREASLLMFVVDARDGLTVLDQSIAERLRAIGKPILLVANKCDGENWESYANDFFRLGLGEVVKCSAKNNRRRPELLDALLERLPDELPDPGELAEPEMKLAIVGRRNVGKSTFVNTLAGSERMIVSEIPGTTRDSVDVRFELDGKTFVAIDTPGLKKGKSIRSDIDFYSDHRAKRSIRHADVVLMFFDCSQRVSKVDKQLVNYIESEYKPCLFVVNKWDLMAPHMPTERWAEYLREQFSSMAYVPIAFITGQEGKNITKLLNHAQM